MFTHGNDTFDRKQEVEELHIRNLGQIKEQFYHRVAAFVIIKLTDNKFQIK